MIAHVHSPAALETPYTVEVRGVDEVDDALRELIDETSQLIALIDKPPATLGGLRRRADSDVERLTTLLRGQGYYAGAVTYAIENEGEDRVVVLTFDVGPVYKLQRFDMKGPDGEPPPIPIDVDELGISLGQPARTSAVLAAESRIVEILAENAYPLARRVDRRAVVDHASRTLAVDVTVDAGPMARFGELTVTGLRDVSMSVIHNKLSWRPGDPYDASKVEAVRRDMMQSGLFTSVSIEHPDTLAPDGGLPLDVAVRERKHRSVGAGAGYSTSEGFGGKVFWEHRNILGEAERLRLTVEAAQIRFAAGATARKPAFLRPDQDLLLDFLAEEERPDAFTSRSVEISAGIERRFGETVAATAGLAFEQSDVEQDGDSEAFTLVSAPLSLRRDTSDDLLDPGRGTRLRLELTPSVDPVASDLAFLTTRMFGAIYTPIVEDRLVLANWGRVGTIVGADTGDIPADKRLYAGGGGSVRGFGFQLVGPVDEDDDPIGGRSSLEFGGELRWRISESFGTVGFIEAGNVFDDVLPDIDETPLWSGGVGLRYHTAIGPLRLDVAFPGNPRAGVDDAFQFYVSIGQAF